MNNNTIFRHRVRSRRVGTSLLGFLMATSVFAGGASQAFADDSASIRRLEVEIQRIEARHQQEIGALRAEIHHLRREHSGNGPIYVNKDEEPAPLLPHVIQSAKGPIHFGFASGDGQNTVELTGRLHIDTGGYLGINRYGAGFDPHGLSSGIDFRRARIGVQGIFLSDWAYALIFDAGGSSDSFNVNNSGFSSSAIENAFITYNGLYSHGGPVPLAFDIGAIDVPWTLDEPNGSNDIMFMERSSAQVVATEYGAGDSRTAIGVRSNNDRYWFGAYLTGPQTGYLHTNTAYTGTSPVGTGVSPQFAGLFRATYNVFQDKATNGSLHLGFNFADTFDPRTGGTGATGYGEGFTLSDRPELRVDPTNAFGANIAAHGGQVFGAEAAATYENFFVEGEYYHYIVDTKDTSPTATGYAVANGPSVGFNGGYVQGSYTFGGRRYYKPTTGAYSGVIPDHPFVLGTGGWGALELAGRFSIVDLNASAPYLAAGSVTAASGTNATGLAHAGTASAAILGGEQTSFGAGASWYPNNNLRFTLDYEHVIEDLPATLGGPNTKGGTIDWLAARSQVVF